MPNENMLRRRLRSMGQRPLAQEMDYQQAILALMEMLRSGGKGMRLR